MKTIKLTTDGNVIEQDFSRSEFAALFDDLNIRDLRPVFSPFQVSTILPRDGAMIVNMGFVKCVLTKSTAYFVIHRHEKRVRDILASLAGTNITTDTSFAMFVLEKLLDAKLIQVQKKMSHIENKADIVLERIRKNFSDADLENLLTIKKRLSKLDARNKEALSAAEEVLADDEDFAQMIALGDDRETTGDELASIFENFIEQLEDTNGHAFRLSEDIEDTEEYVHLKLNARRTSIIRADLLATLFTLILSFLAVIVGLYGVNIRNGLEENEAAFYVLATLLVIFLVVGITGIIIFLKKKHLF